MIASQEQQKRTAAEHAAAWIRDGMKIGLGSGSTVRHLLDCIAEARARGGLGSIVCVPTSEDTAEIATRFGIPLGRLADHPELDITIDGADEVDPDLRLIKGLGGALLREKIVASFSRRFVIMVDASKRVEKLGTRSPVPVEVDAFAADALIPFFRSLGAEPEFRVAADGERFRTDGGHLIVDCRFPRGIDRPEALDRDLHLRPGVVETGLFLGMADTVVVATAAGTQELTRKSGSRP